MSRTATTQEEVKDELENYLHDKGISNLFIHVVETMLLHKPDNPIQFIMDHLQKNYPDQITSGDPTSKSSVVAAVADRIDTDLLLESDDEDDEDDDLITSVRAIPIARRTRRRNAISANVLTNATLKSIHPPVFEKTDEQKNRLREILRKNMLFQVVTPADIEVLVDAFEPQETSKNKTILKQGNISEEFYILEGGEAEVWQTPEDGGEARKLMTYEDGSEASFNDLALLYSSKNAATVKASGNGPVKVWVLQQDVFRKVVGQAHINQYEQRINFLKDVKILRTVTDVERQIIAGALQPVEYNAGQVIMRQGDKGDVFYIIVKGEVVCTQQDTPQTAPKEVLRLNDGGYFGEIALLTNRPRQATVTAVRHTKILKLDRSRFKRLVGSLKEILRRNLNFYKTFVTEQM